VLVDDADGRVVDDAAVVANGAPASDRRGSEDERDGPSAITDDDSATTLDAEDEVGAAEAESAAAEADSGVQRTASDGGALAGSLEPTQRHDAEVLLSALAATPVEDETELDESEVGSSPGGPTPGEVIDIDRLLDDIGAAVPVSRRGDVVAPHRLPAAERASGEGVAPPVVVPTWRQRRAARRLQARKVGRILRNVDPWTVLKVSLLFYLCAFLMLLFSGVLLWAAARSFGVVGDIEGFITEALTLESFAFDGRQIFRLAALAGLALVVAATSATVVLAITFNLICNLTGGIRLVVVEEESARPVLRAPSEI